MTRRAPVVSAVTRVGDGLVFVPTIASASTRQSTVKRAIR